jgi:hypothetical protein
MLVYPVLSVITMTKAVVVVVEVVIVAQKNSYSNTVSEESVIAAQRTEAAPLCTYRELLTAVRSHQQHVLHMLTPIITQCKHQSALQPLPKALLLANDHSFKCQLLLVIHHRCIATTVQSIAVC